MIYTKPLGVRYVDMAIYVDNMIDKGKDNLSEEEINTIYQYLFHLSYMLAHKHKFFNDSHYYEEFSLYFANIVIYRLLYNPKLYIYDDNGEPLLPHIKSCLNYMKSIVYCRKVDFEQENYCQKFSHGVEINNQDSVFLFTNQVSSSMDPMSNVDIRLYLRDISKTVRHFLKERVKEPSGSILFKYIYLSCMISLLNSITFNKDQTNKMREAYSSVEAKQNYLDKCYQQNKDECVVLYHLDKSYFNYIKVLVRHLYTLIGNDIKDLSFVSIPIDNDVLKEMVFVELDGTGGAD